MKTVITAITIILIFSVASLRAQIYPVTATNVMPFPHSAFLFDYYEPSATNLQVTLQLNDFTVASQTVKLRFEIEGENVQFNTKPNYQPTNSIVLTPGVPLVLQGSALFDALNLSNLELQGISPAAFNQSGGQLPEGQYNFCVTVLDFNSGKELSQPACANIFVQMEQPPVLITPECGTFIPPSTPQNLRFNWQVQGMGQPSFFGQNTYILHLYQITDPAADPQNAVLNSKAVKVYESQPVSQNNLTLDFSTILLIPGEKYVFRMQGIGPEGKNTFLNEGYSEWCWFFYGYPEGGTINLQAPFERQQFKKTDQKTFAWSNPDQGMQGQSYDYKITIVALNDSTQDPADAILNNPSYHEETLPPTTSQNGANFLLSGDLPPDKTFVWKIEAFTEGQKVAESPVQTFLSHTLIDHFFASNQRIEVVQATNADLNNFSGKARIQLSEDETDFIDVDFSGLKIKEVAGDMILEAGQIDFELADRDRMEVPAQLEVNGFGEFEYISGTIDPSGLKVDGKLVWLLPHAVAPGEATEVISERSTFIMDAEGKLTGEAAIEPFNTVLLAPNGFELALKPSSKLQLSSNEIVVNVRGSVRLPESVKTIADSRVEITFDDFQNSLDYIEIPNLLGMLNGGIAPVDDLKLEYIPTGPGVLDFSEDESPEKLGGNKSWKGFYIRDYKIRLNVAGFDPSNQIKIPERIDLNQTTENTSHRFWIDGTGLTLKNEFELNEVEGLRFNSFQTKSFKVEFDIDKSEYKKATFSGSTAIPFIDESRDFEFVIPGTEESLEQGYLEGLEDLEFIYNPYGGENRMDLVINRVAFVDNAYLSLNCDITVPELGAEIKGLDDLRIYGDHVVGVGGRNASVALDEPVTARFKELDVTITELGAAYYGGDYAMSLQMESFLSEGFTDAGDDGPPTFSISSVAATSAEAAPGTNIPAPQIEVPEGLAGKSEIEPTGFDINIETPVVDAGAYLLFYQDDPTWGTRFSAGINASVKVPARYNLGGNMTLGMIDGMDYWYFDAYFEDVDGDGIQIIEASTATKITNIVGIEGQIFRHVKAKKNEEDEFELALSPNTQFGAKVFMQFIDPYSRGFLYQADMGLEMEIQGAGYSIENVEWVLTGQAAFLNINFRTGSSASPAVAMDALESAGVADAIIDELFPQTVNIGGTDITVDSKGLSVGSSLEIGDFEGGSGILLGAAVSASPSLEIGLAKDGYSIYGAGDAEGNAELELEIPGAKLEAELVEKTQGSFGLAIGDLSTHFSGDYVKKKADFDFSYNDVSLELGIDVPNKAGNFGIEVDGVAVGAFLNVAAKTGGLNFDYDDKHFLIDYDGNELASNLELAFGDFEFKNSLNISERRGSLFLSTSVGEVDIIGSTEEALFHAESGSYLFHVESNFAEKTGKLGIEFPNHELRGEIGTERGDVFMRKDNFEVGLGGRYDGTAGDLHVREGDFVFDLGADLNETTGYLNLSTGSEAFSSNFDLADTSFIQFEKGADIYEARLANSYLKTQVKSGDYHFLLEIDPDNIAGKTLFQIPDFRIATDFSAAENFASAGLEFAGHSMDSYIRDDSLAIKYEKDGLKFQVAGKYGGSGSVFFADPSKSLATGFSYDIENQAGAINFQKDDFSIAVAGNATAGTGEIDLQLASDHFRAGLNDSLYVSTAIDDFGFSAMYRTDKTSASFSYAGNSIYAAKLSNGEELQLTLPDHSFALGREGNQLSGRYVGNDLVVGATVGGSEVGFDLSKGDISLGASANAQKQISANFSTQGYGVAVSGDLNADSYTTTLTKDDWEGSATVALGSNTTTLSLSKGDLGVAGAFSGSAQTLDYQIGDFTIKGGLTGSIPGFNIGWGDAEFEFGGLLSGNTAPSINLNGLPPISFQHPDLGFSLGNLGSTPLPDFDIDLGGTNFTIATLNTCALDLKKNNNPLSFVGDTFDETISGQHLRISLNPDNSKSVLLENSDLSVDIHYDCSTLPEIKVNKGGKQYVFVVKSDEVQLAYDDHSFRYAKAQNEVEFKKGNEYLFRVSDAGLDTDLGGYYLKADQSEFSAGKGTTYLQVDDSQVALHADDKFVELHSDDTYLVQVGTGKNLSLTPTSLEVNVDSKRLFVDENTLSASDTQEAFAILIDNDSLSIQKGQYGVMASADGAKFRRGADYVSVSNDALAVKYDGREAKVTSAKVVSYKDADRELIASPSSLYLDYEGKILEVTTDQVRIELASDKKFLAKKELLSAEYEGYQVQLKSPLTNPEFTYSDADNSLSLSQESLAILISGKGVEVGPDKLKVIEGDNFLQFTENDMSLKYGKYEAQFTDWDDVFLTNGIQQFSIEGTRVSASIDANNTISANLDLNAPELELVHDDTRLAVGTDRAEFDYEGMHYALGTSDDYIRVNEIAKPEEGFAFSNEGIRYIFGENRSVSVAPTGNFFNFQYDDKRLSLTDEYSLEFALENEKYVTTVSSDLAASFVANNEHSIELNQEDYIVGYTYLPKDAFIRLKRFEDNYYGLVAGADKYAGFIKPAEGNSIEIGAMVDGLGQTSVTVNKNKDIGVKLQQSAETMISVGIEKAKTLEFAKIKIDGMDIINFGGDVDAFGDPVEGVAAVGGDGPARIAVLTEKAGGWAVGGIAFRATVGKDLGFVANGRMQTGLTIPVMCANIPFGMEISPGKFKYSLADKNNWATMNLLCFGGLDKFFYQKGYGTLSFDATGSSADISVGLGYEIGVDFSGGFSVSVLACEIGVSAGVRAYLAFGGEAAISIPYSGSESPELSIGPVFAELGAQAWLSASACGYSFDVSAGIKGRLEMEGSLEGARAEGTASGHVSVCGLSKDFEFEVGIEI